MILTDWFLILLVFEIAFFGIFQLFHLSRIRTTKKQTQYVRPYVDPALTRRQQLYDPTDQQPLRVSQSMIHPASQPLPLPINVCEKCGLALTDHSIAQAINCGYNEFSKAKLNDLRDYVKFIID